MNNLLEVSWLHQEISTLRTCSKTTSAKSIQHGSSLKGLKTLFIFLYPVALKSTASEMSCGWKSRLRLRKNPIDYELSCKYITLKHLEYKKLEAMCYVNVVNTHKILHRHVFVTTSFFSYFFLISEKKNHNFFSS